MKRLYLVRHAKSSWSYEGLPDIDRPLNERGYRDAHAMGEYLVQNNFKAGIFLSSPAIRALTTALIFSRSGLIPLWRIQLEQSLFETDEHDYLAVIKLQEDSTDDLYVFGHNPTISDLFRLLGPDLSEEMTTCNVGIIEFDCNSWKDIEFGSGINKKLLKPSQIHSM